MAIKKVIMRPEGSNDYTDELHPKTSLDMVVGGGSLASLTTTDKTSLVGAINSVNSKEISKTSVGLANVDNVKQMPIAGGTFTGVAKSQANTSYTTSQLRNVVLSTANPSGGSNGDIWIKYL